MFGYKCSECGEGTVREKKFLSYQTKIKGYPFVINEAKLGVCDKCGSEYFTAKETKRWERLFEQALIEDKLFLIPEDIVDLRQQLGLSMEQFALLIGCTRQSLYNWEKSSRSHPQSRTVDMIMKLVNKSRIEGKVDVISFLMEEARKLGITIKLPREKWESTDLSDSLILKVEQIIEQRWTEAQPEAILQYVAQNDIKQAITVVKKVNGERVGKLIYQYLNGNIVLELEQEGLDLSDYEVKLITIKGERVRGKIEQIAKGKFILLKSPDYTDRDLKEVHLIPKIG